MSDFRHVQTFRVRDAVLDRTGHARACHRIHVAVDDQARAFHLFQLVGDVVIEAGMNKALVRLQPAIQFTPWSVGSQQALVIGVIEVRAERHHAHKTLKRGPSHLAVDIAE